MALPMVSIQARIFNFLQTGWNRQINDRTFVFRFRTCVLLCLPALLLAVWLRVLAMQAAPEAYVNGDSNSYIGPAYSLWEEGRFDISEKRRWLYPIFLMPLPLLPGNMLQAVAVIQHLAGLAAIVAIGWITAHICRAPRFSVPAVTLLVAASPRMLWYEHQAVADSLVLPLFVLALALLFPLYNVREKRLPWVVFFCALTVGLKPHGKPLIIGIMAVALLASGDFRKWRWSFWLNLALLGFFFITSGSSRQGNWLLLSSTLPMLPENGKSFPEYRKSLQPVIAEARTLGAQYPWQQLRYKKLLANSKSYIEVTKGRQYASTGPEWPGLVKRKKEYEKVCGAFAKEALLANPLQFLYFSSIKAACSLADDEIIGLTHLEPVRFWDSQARRNAERDAEMPQFLPLVYEARDGAFDQLAAARKARANTPDLAMNPVLKLHARVLWFRETVKDGIGQVKWTWAGLLGLCGIAASISGGRFAASFPANCALALSLAACYGVGDRISRYVLPVEWITWMLPVLALATVWQWLKARVERQRLIIAPLPQTQAFPQYAQPGKPRNDKVEI